MMMLIKDKTAANEIDTDTIEQIELLLYQETEFLDAQNYDQWLALFTDDCIYWVPEQVNQNNPHDHISLFHEDKTLMKMRIERLGHPQAHSLSDPIRTSHVCSQYVLESIDADSGNITVSARFIMSEYYRNEQRVFSGRYFYELRETNGSILIKTKRVELINCDAILEPIQVFI
jgi:ethylbenzene dioxygenase subunit beta